MKLQRRGDGWFCKTEVGSFDISIWGFPWADHEYVWCHYDLSGVQKFRGVCKTLEVAEQEIKDYYKGVT